MENEKLQLTQPYRGPSKFQAAYENALASTLLTALGTAAVWALGTKLFKKVPFTSKYNELLRSKSIWGASTGIALVGSYSTYKNAEATEEQYNQLTVQNAIYKNQLKEASIDPANIVSMRKKNIADLPLTSTVSHGEKIIAEKAIAADASHAV